MSRSALARSMLLQQKEQQKELVGSVPPPPPPPQLVMPMPPFMMPGMTAGMPPMPGVLAMPGMVPVIGMPGMLVPPPGMQGMSGMIYAPTAPQGHVPIRLTGDDEDDFESPEHKTNALPMHGNTSNYNINSLLHNNIMESEYFRALYQLRTYHEVLHEIGSRCVHVEPWQTGTQRNPSTAFCLLLKLLLMKLTFKQMKGMLEYADSPIVRAIGFLYLRYTCPPDDLWKWFESYLEDDEEISPSANPDLKMTIEEKQKRRRSNLRLEEDGHFREGTKVRAIYSDADNEPAWYEAVIDSKDEDTPNKFWVTFPEYGNNECVDLGDMELLDDPSKRGGGGRERDERGGRSGGGRSSRSNSRDRRSRSDRDRDRGDRDCSRRGKDSRSRSRSRGRDEDGGAPRVANLMEKVLQSERQASAATGRNYGQRPASYKGSLALKIDRHTVREKSPDRADRGGGSGAYRGGGGGGGGGGRHDRGERGDRERGDRGDRDRNRDRDRAWEGYGGGERGRGGDKSPARASSMSTSSGMSAEQQERMKKLKAQYGDASAR